MQCDHQILFVRIFITALALAICAAGSLAQTDVENAINQLDAVNVRGYIQPLADLYGADISAGSFRSAYIPRDGISVHLDLLGMVSQVTDGEKTYTVQLPPGYTQKTAVQPTIFGPAATVVKDPSGFQYKGSDGMIDASYFPHGVAQLTIGSFDGTEAFGRLFITPALGTNKLPKTTLYGGGVRHSISQYLGDPPLDIAAGFSYNRMTIGDLITINAVTIGAQASKNWSILGVYGGLAWEKNSLTLNYTPTASGVATSIDIDGANTFCATGGVTLSLGFLRLFADANLGSVTTFSGGIGFGN